MISVLLALAGCSQLQVLESYEVEGVLSREKGQHEVYLLVLFKAPTDAAVASGAFARFINAIPIPINPFLGIVVDPSVSYNQLLYQDKAGTSDRIRFPYRQILREYVESISKGVSHEVRLRLQAILSTVNDAPHTSKLADEQTEHDKALEHWKSVYETKGVRRNMTQAVEDLVALKNQERAGLIKQALAIQKRLDALVPPRGRRLPDFAEVDPSKGEYEAQVSDDDGVESDEKEKPAKVKRGFDEEAAENDDVVGEDEAPKSLANTKPQGDDDDENAGTTDDDAEEEKKRAGPIKAVMEKIKVGWRKVVGRAKNPDGSDAAAKKKAKGTKADAEGTEKNRGKHVVEQDSDDNPDPKPEAPARPPEPQPEVNKPEDAQPLAPVQPPPPATEPPPLATEPPPPATDPPPPATESPPPATEPPPLATEPPPPATEPPAATPEPPAATPEPPAATPEPPDAPPAPAQAPVPERPARPPPVEVPAPEPPLERESRALPHRRAYGEPVSRQEQPKAEPENAEPAQAEPVRHVRRERRPIVDDRPAGDRFVHPAPAAGHGVRPVGDKVEGETTAQNDKPPHRFHRDVGPPAAAERRQADREDGAKAEPQPPPEEVEAELRRARLAKLRARRAALAREAAE